MYTCMTPCCTIQEEAELVSMVTSGGRVECERPASDDDDVFVDALRYVRELCPTKAAIIFHNQYH